MYILFYDCDIEWTLGKMATGECCVDEIAFAPCGQRSVHAARAAKTEPLHTYDICERGDLRAHALWYLVLVVVLVVMVMALFRGCDNGEGRWPAYSL